MDQHWKKRVLLLSLIGLPSLLLSQLQHTETAHSTTITDTIYPLGMMRIQVNEKYKILTIHQLSQEEFAEPTELKIVSIQQVADGTRITSGMDVADEKPLVITLNQALNTLTFQTDKSTTTFAGEGLNIIFSNTIDLKRCRIKD